MSEPSDTGSPDSMPKAGPDDPRKSHKPEQEQSSVDPEKGLSDSDANYPDGATPSSGGPSRRRKPPDRPERGG